MFSKEWKLLAVCALAIVSLTACPHNKKKKDSQTAYAGHWINPAAYNELRNTSLAQTQDPQFCSFIYRESQRLGIKFAPGGVMLDAYVIYGNGDVYRYLPGAPRDPQYLEGRIVGTSCRRSGNGFGSYGFCGQQSSLYLDRNMLSVSGYGYGGGMSELYMRVNPRELEHIAVIVNSCRRHGHGHPYQNAQCLGPQCAPVAQPLPQQLGPQVPQYQPQPQPQQNLK